MANMPNDRTIVYDAAKDGKIIRLKTFLATRTKEEIQKLIHAKSNGATPLIMAARNGHLEIAKYLIGECKAQIEQVGSVTFDGETIEGAPPLWCAAAAGYIEIVEYLVEKGADVNKTTFTNSTPMRAACFDGHLGIVKFLVARSADIEIANRHGHTCLMISCYKKHFPIVDYLIKLKAKVNRTSLKGNTALHDCAESGSLDILKLLLRHGAIMVKDHYSMTPLMAAAVAGFQPIVEYLIGRPEPTKLEKIEALELIGATFVDRNRDNMAAFEFWQRALKLRCDDGPHKLLKPEIAKPLEAYDFAVEARTSSELYDLLCDPDEMRMQALIVRERILGPAHPDTSYYIRYRGALYADMGNFDRCISLWMHALDMQQGAMEPISPMTQSSFLSFAELFSFMVSDRRRKEMSFRLKSHNLMHVLERSVEEISRGLSVLSSSLTSNNGTVKKECLSQADTHTRNLTNLNRLMIIVLHLLCLMARLEHDMDIEDDGRKMFRRVVYQLIKLNPRGLQSNSFLHLACSRDTTDVGRYPICKFPSIDVINLLVHVGADVNAQNSDGNSPLHIAALNDPSDHQVMKILIESGSHLDARNSSDQTAEQLLHGVSLYAIIPPLRYTTLQCLASRVIALHGIPYIGVVGSDLEKTIQIHKGLPKGMNNMGLKLKAGLSSMSKMSTVATDHREVES